MYSDVYMYKSSMVWDLRGIGRGDDAEVTMLPCSDLRTNMNMCTHIRVQIVSDLGPERDRRRWLRCRVYTHIHNCIIVRIIYISTQMCTGINRQ